MTEQHPIIPTGEQLTEWDSEYFDGYGQNFDVMMIKAFQAGADQELDACVEWLRITAMTNSWRTVAELAPDLRADRRPEPPSLKEQALEALNSFEGFTGSLEEVDIIRRALESIYEENN